MPAQARLETALAERLGLEVPIFGFSHGVAVTAAISNAGGLGVYGATRDTPGMRSRFVRSVEIADRQIATVAQIAAVR